MEKKMILVCVEKRLTYQCLSNDWVAWAYLSQQMKYASVETKDEK